MRDVYIPLSERRLMTQERERRGTETMFLSKQEEIGPVHKWKDWIYPKAWIVLPS